MVRAVLSGHARIGLDTLAAFVEWDGEFDKFALDLLHERGEQIRRGRTT